MKKNKAKIKQRINEKRAKQKRLRKCKYNNIKNKPVKKEDEFGTI